MNSKWLKIGLAVVVIVVIAVAAVSASAQGTRGGWGFAGADSLISVAAEKLGIEPADLIAQLNDGKTIAELAEAKGVALDTIVDAFLAPRVERMQSAVDAKWMTQELADTMLANMKAQVTLRLAEPFTTAAPGGFGPGMGHGMMGGMMGRGMGMMGGGMGMMGHGTGGYNGYGFGMGFMDADGDGVCDFYPYGQQAPATGSSS